MASFDTDDWADIIPIPQNDGPHPVVQINYAEDFVKLMDIFRAIVAKGEFSERVLSLTEDLLSLNPGSYTVWQYRRACLRALKSDLNAEIQYMDSFADENPKNYQIWQHRRVIVEMIGDGTREKVFCEKIFEEDAKNYHAWAHRQWAVKRFDLWDGEIEFVNSCLELDVRNNSAWNHRWFLIHQNPSLISDEVIAVELDFTLGSINVVSKNESSWNYLRGLVNAHTSIVMQVITWIETFITDEEHANNYFALGLLADLRESEGSKASLELSIGLFKQLISADPMRIKSWTRRIHLATAKLQTF